MWITKHVLVPKIMGPLHIYDILLSSVEKMGMKLIKIVKPPGLCALGLCSRSSTLNFSFISLVEEYKVVKCWQYMTLSLSSDKNICNQEIKTSTGRKWKIELVIGRAIVTETTWDLMGAVKSQQHSIRFLPMGKPWWLKANNHQRKQLVTEQIQSLNEEKQMAVAVQQLLQGA